MSKIGLADLLEQDIRDLEGVFAYEDYGLTQEQAKMQAKGVMANLKTILKN